MIFLAKQIPVKFELKNKNLQQQSTLIYIFVDNKKITHK